jgi:hypothetical protein
MSLDTKRLVDSSFKRRSLTWPTKPSTSPVISKVSVPNDYYYNQQLLPTAAATESVFSAPTPNKREGWWDT